MQFSEFKDKIIHKNTLFALYFIFFILLNILDFLGKLSSDLDFLKKILSWVVIWVLFYQISFTKIFIGERLRRYDIAYIIGFSILIIPKLLNHYFKDVVTSNFIIFQSVVPIIISILNNFLNLLGSVFLAIIILMLTNFTLLSNHKVQPKSFIGSLNLKSQFGHRMTTHLSLFFLVFFFAFVIAPFFLEWFALSVDALILVMGLIYYLIVFIHKYREGGKISNFLKLVSNSGTQFFKDLIQTFSHKKTFFVGVSFLLAVHLIVDVGVYMVPYLIGTSSPLYFETLSAEGRDHIPLFNVFDVTYSQSYSEISTIFSEENNSTLVLKIIQFIFIVLLYISSYLYFFILLCFPFFYIYKRIKNQLIVIPKIFVIFIIAMSLFYIISQDTFMTTISMPISIGITQSVGVEGVDIFTSPIFKENQNITSVDFSDTISLLIFFLMVFFLFVFIRFQKYKHIFTSLTYIIFLLFFITYISLFYYDFNSGVFDRITNSQEVTTSSSSYNYTSYKSYINKNDIITSPLTHTIDNKVILKGKVYTHKDKISFFYGKYELLIEEEKFKNNPHVGIEQNNFVVIKIDHLEILENENTIKELEKSYSLGEKSYQSKENSKNIQEGFLTFISYIAFFFSTIFYIIGMLIFSKHYLKTLYLGDLK